VFVCLCVCRLLFHNSVPITKSSKLDNFLEFRGARCSIIIIWDVKYCSLMYGYSTVDRNVEKILTYSRRHVQEDDNIQNCL
jgi:hypothetical protein